MTVREEAYGLIDRLPEDSVRAVIQIMRRMSPQEANTMKRSSALTPKQKAFQELQAMRKKGAKFDFSTEERVAALHEKFGSFVWNGGAE